jgi:hypothetical protein
VRDRQTCIDCGKVSPETDTNYTLISAQFGWRLSRRRAPGGDFVVEWRCAECWRDHKKKHGDAAAEPRETRPSSMNNRAPSERLLRPAAAVEKKSVGGGSNVRSSRPPPRSSNPPVSGVTSDPPTSPRSRRS